MSHELVADKLGIRRSAVSQWIALTGKRTSPRLSRLPEIARLLGCDLEWLLSGEGDPRPRVPLSSADAELLDTIRRLPPHQRQALIRFIDSLLPFENEAQVG